MPLAYTPPGVTVEEFASPTVNPLLAVSASIALVGMSRGYQTITQRVTFAANSDAVDPVVINVPVGVGGTVQRVLEVGAGQTFVSAKDTLDPTKGATPNQGGYKQGTGVYNASTNNYDYSAVVSNNNTTITVTPRAGSTLDSQGATVDFVLRVIPDNYFEAIRLDSQSSVEERFGPAYSPTGVGTPLSHAAALAFENGASSVVLQPLYRDAAGVRTQPTATEAAASAQWTTTLLGIRDIEDINIIVPVVGQSDANVGDTSQLSILQAIQDHQAFMLTQGQYIVSVFGEDSAADLTEATPAVLRNHASILRDRHGGTLAEQTVFVSPSRFARSHPINNSVTYTVGGQYMAAALAGMIAARSVSAPITRKQVSGFQAVTDPRDRSAKDLDAASGLLVVEQKGLAVQVRHGITLDTSSTAKRELSVVRAKHRMIESLRDTLDNQVIGQVPADGNAPLLVKSAVIGVLESLRQRRELVEYGSVQARTLNSDPTTVEVRFNYRPAFPLNFVRVVFSLNLNEGLVNTNIAESTL